VVSKVALRIEVTLATVELSRGYKGASDCAGGAILLLGGTIIGMTSAKVELGDASRIELINEDAEDSSAELVVVVFKVVAGDIFATLTDDVAVAFEVEVEVVLILEVDVVLILDDDVVLTDDDVVLILDDVEVLVLPVEQEILTSASNEHMVLRAIVEGMRTQGDK
jgi:hypothetical protein